MNARPILAALAAVAAALAISAPSATADTKVDVSTLYAAPHATSRPVLVLIHGGGWEFGTTDQTTPWARFLRSEGYPVINAAYRLACATPAVYVAAQIPQPADPPDCSPGSKAVLDIARQVRWARAHHAALGTSSRQVVLVGFSAGGHLAALVAVRGIADAAIGFSAPTSLAFSSSDLAPYVGAFVGCSYVDCPQQWRALSPAAYRTKRPLYLAYGQHEKMVPAAQGDALKHDPNARIVRVPGAQHTSADFNHGWERPQLARALAFVKSELAKEDAAAPKTQNAPPPPKWERGVARGGHAVTVTKTRRLIGEASSTPAQDHPGFGPGLYPY